MKLTEIKEQLGKITKWPWTKTYRYKQDDYVICGKKEGIEEPLISSVYYRQPDAAFIASAPVTIDRLCRALDAAREMYEVNIVTEDHEEAMNGYDKVIEKYLSGEEQGNV